MAGEGGGADRMVGVQEEAGRRENQRNRDKWGGGGWVGEGCCEWYWASQAGTGKRPGGGRMLGPWRSCRRYRPARDTFAGGGCGVDPAQTTATGGGGEGFFSSAYAFWLAAWDASKPLSRFTRPG